MHSSEILYAIVISSFVQKSNSVYHVFFRFATLQLMKICDFSVIFPLNIPVFVFVSLQFPENCRLSFPELLFLKPAASVSEAGIFLIVGFGRGSGSGVFGSGAGI